MDKPTLEEMRHAVVYDTNGIAHAAKLLGGGFAGQDMGWILIPACRANVSSAMYQSGVPNCIRCLMEKDHAKAPSR